MTADPRLVAIRRRAIEAMTPPAHLALLRRIEQTHTDDGMIRGSRIVESVAVPALPAIDTTQILAPEGAAFSDLEAYLASLEASGVNYLTVASPLFTGTLVGPNAALTGTLSVDGDTTLGNSSTDVLIARGHLRHKSSAPSIAVGAALGTGGSVGVTIAGTDQRMQITLTAGTTSLAAGTAATITLATARPNTQTAVALCPNSSAARVNAVQAGIAGHGTTTVVVSFSVAPTSGTAYSYDVFVDEWTN